MYRVRKFVLARTSSFTQGGAFPQLGHTQRNDPKYANNGERLNHPEHEDMVRRCLCSRSGAPRGPVKQNCYIFLLFFVRLSMTMEYLNCHCDETDPLFQGAPCETSWLCRGWRCPYLWRPHDIDVRIGSVIQVTLRTARMWSARLGESHSIVIRSRGLQWEVFAVCGIHRARHYTQLHVEELDSYEEGWINVWHRYNANGDCCGVQWARVVQL
jgi:hypothetical protein